ncbi:hypothetical protein SS50377_23801 [Spironucleus salmonicida]|uniref:Uncharacterized protein n=1 Tax=Spironucleus salmonicida TaxID=348837 RepID=V6M032_9EUKA|nr:hypothetical protein SS50377_23801 [Spironucleus salmonicida]|eukprot:EST46479.1 Hypothetical protein SS50377_13561 [Spironucleus salmonicida]
MQEILSELRAIQTQFFLQQPNFSTFEQDFLTFKALLVVVEYSTSEVPNLINALQGVVSACAPSTTRNILVENCEKLRNLEPEKLSLLIESSVLSYEQRLKLVEADAKMALSEAREAKRNCFYAIFAAILLLVFKR